MDNLTCGVPNYFSKPLHIWPQDHILTAKKVSNKVDIVQKRTRETVFNETFTTNGCKMTLENVCFNVKIVFLCLLLHKFAEANGKSPLMKEVSFLILFPVGSHLQHY